MRATANKKKANKPSARNYSQKTLKVLFAFSGNQCAFPECTNPIAVSATSASDPAILAQICHIYASSDIGPRGKVGLTARQRNSPENLILMCGVHHPLVDQQWETYPADSLFAWKAAHERRFQPETAEAAKRQLDMQKLAYLQRYSDQQIAAEVERIRKCRFIQGFDADSSAITLANRIDIGELSGGSPEARARALAWCARFLSHDQHIPLAKELIG